MTLCNGSHPVDDCRIVARRPIVPAIRAGKSAAKNFQLPSSLSSYACTGLITWTRARFVLAVVTMYYIQVKSLSGRLAVHVAQRVTSAVSEGWLRIGQVVGGAPDRGGRRDAVVAAADDDGEAADGGVSSSRLCHARAMQHA